MVRKFLQEEEKTPSNKGKKEKFEKLLKEPKGIVIGGVLAVVSVAILFSLRGEETKVEVSQAISPSQVEVALKQKVEPLIEGQKSLVQKITQANENLKQLIGEIKVLVRTIKEENKETSKQEGNKSSVPQSVWKFGNFPKCCF